VHERRARIHDDLRGLISGDLLFEAVDRAPYAQDGSLYEIDPLGVVIPRTGEELRATVRYAAENSIPLHARGAGAGLAGESLGHGLVIDFSRYLRRIVEIRPTSVVVQPGVVLDELNAQLAPLGRRIGPDPGGSESCTIGGMISGDAAGARSLRYGTTADHVERLEVIFANGETGTLGLEPWPALDGEPANFHGAVARRVAMHLTWHADLIARGRPVSPRNRAGYALWAVGAPGGINLARLIVGSEGTLALVTEATLRTVPVPAAQGVALLPFGRLVDAALAVSACVADAPSACELIDWRRLSLARDADADYRSWIAGSAEAAVVVEFEDDDPDLVASRVRSLADRIARTGALVGDPAIAFRRADCDRLLGLPRAITPSLLRARGPARPVPLIEDVAVPPSAVGEYLRRLQNILKRHELNWTFHAHAGHGQVHARPFLDLASPADRTRIEPLALEVYETVFELGGTISGEHGCGLARSQFLKRQYGELFHVFREIKYAFDPQNLLNPGKIVGGDAHAVVQHLRSCQPVESNGAPTQGALPVLDLPLHWPDRPRSEHLAACNGCGACRSLEPTLRMCPTFRATRSEAAAPRAQVNLLRMIAAGSLDPRSWGSDELKRHSDLCVHCNLCRSECPAGLDVSALMIEAKAAYVEAHGLTPTDWMLARVETWAHWASRLPVLGNGLIASRPARWMLERLFGLARHRVLPRAHRWPFLGRAERKGWTRPRPEESGPRAAYFVDIFANYFDQELAESVVAVLRHAGVNVFVPKGQRGCGMPALVAGDLEHARELLLTNLRVLANAVREGYTIVCSEPTAALMLAHEALRLTDDLDAGLVGANTMDVGQYLAGLHGRGLLPPPPKPIPARVGYHQPCHLRALEVGTPGLDLIRLIPELKAEFIDRGCSGIAGTFGLARRNFRTSLRAGRGLRRRLRDADIELGATECGACRMQMEQGLAKRTYHPVKLLSVAYGLNSTLAQRLMKPKPRNVIS
jgi:FAD/FMN-containing dehydrogenase/Fe-S oxidoreductase